MAPHNSSNALTALRCAVRARATARARVLGGAEDPTDGLVHRQARLTSTSRDLNYTGQSRGPRRSASSPNRHGAEPHVAGSTSYPAEEKHPGAVYVKIHPRPQTLAESGQVLALLRQFGDVEMYRHLKYTPSAPAHNSVVAIFRQPEAAARAIAASPIQFTLGGDTEGFEGLWDDVEKRLESEAAGIRSSTVPAAASDPASMELVEDDSMELEDDDSSHLQSNNTPPAWENDEDDPDFVTDIGSAQNLVTPGDPELFAGSADGAAIQPPWEAMLAAATPQGSPSGDLSHSHSHTVSLAPDTAPISSSDTLSAHDPLSDPANPIALPRLPDTAPVIAPAPAYRHSGLSATARQQPALRPPTYDTDPSAHPPARAAKLQIQASGLAHRFFNLRQPYFGRFQASETAFPGDGVLGSLPLGLHGLASSDPHKPEVAARQRDKAEQARQTEELLAGKSLREVWFEGQRGRYRRMRRGESELEWAQTVSKI